MEGCIGTEYLPPTYDNLPLSTLGGMMYRRLLPMQLMISFRAMVNPCARLERRFYHLPCVLDRMRTDKLIKVPSSSSRAVALSPHLSLS